MPNYHQMVSPIVAILTLNVMKMTVIPVFVIPTIAIPEPTVHANVVIIVDPAVMMHAKDKANVSVLATHVSIVYQTMIVVQTPTVTKYATMVNAQPKQPLIAPTHHNIVSPVINNVSTAQMTIIAQTPTKHIVTTTHTNVKHVTTIINADPMPTAMHYATQQFQHNMNVTTQTTQTLKHATPHMICVQSMKAHVTSNVKTTVIA
jgi:hypothetical protein